MIPSLDTEAGVEVPDVKIEEEDAEEWSGLGTT
jgi:hypothetical protein